MKYFSRIFNGNFLSVKILFNNIILCISLKIVNN